MEEGEDRSISLGGCLMTQSETKDWLAVHDRLCHGDIAAKAMLTEYFLPWLSQKLLHRCFAVDAHWAIESAEDALLDYLAKPQHFDARRGLPLGYWLLLQARGHLSHRRRSEQRRRVHECALGGEGKIFSNWLSEMALKRAIYRRREKDAMEEQKQVLENALSQLSLPDRHGLELLREEASFEEWVEHLGIALLPTSEQRRKINAEKARLKKKMQRWVSNQTRRRADRGL